jgi:hypothetical protein
VKTFVDKDGVTWVEYIPERVDHGRRYVVGFMFDFAFERVALIRKRKPIWQAGKLNGIGGKIEANETREEAMRREFIEEAGFDATWHFYCNCAGINNNGAPFSLDCFWSQGSRIVINGPPDLCCEPRCKNP